MRRLQLAWLVAVTWLAKERCVWMQRNQPASPVVRRPKSHRRPRRHRKPK